MDQTPKTITLFGRTLHLIEGHTFYQSPQGSQPRIHVQPYADKFSGNVSMGAAEAFLWGDTLQELEANLGDRIQSRAESYRALALELGLVKS